jgi:nicotinamide phosphoribosyltransferase
MSFKSNSLYLVDGYKLCHKAMLTPGTVVLAGSWVPRSLKHAPRGITKIVSFGQQICWMWLHDEFQENFFGETKENALQFVKDMSLYLGMEYDGEHFGQLWDLGFLPIRAKALPEGIETDPNIPHMTFINTVDGFAWLPLYLEIVVSSLAWKPSTAATIAKLYRRQAEEWVAKTDPANMWLVDFMCHDFSARGLDPMSQWLIGLGHATSFKGSDTLPVIPASRYFYGVGKDEMPIFSVNASEHSVSTTKIFTVGEQQMVADWLKIFPKGILSIVADTFDLWTLITKFLPANKDAIMSREGKLVIRPDSGDPVDIICGLNTKSEEFKENWLNTTTGNKGEYEGVIELLWNIFGGTVNEQGYKVLDPHIGAIYGDSITPERQRQIYERLAAKGFAATNIVLGVGSFTYQYNTRDTFGFAAKGTWFEVLENSGASIGEVGTMDVPKRVGYSIFKDPITDDGTKKSLKGLLAVTTESLEPDSDKQVIVCLEECTPEEESKGLLQTIYEDGKFYNQVTLEQVRQTLLNSK